MAKNTSGFYAFVKKIRQFLQNNTKIDNFMFLPKSPEIFELERCTIPHFIPPNKLI